MLSMTESARARFLFVKYVSARWPMDLKFAHECVLREKRAAEQGIIRVSPGLLTELRAECQELAVLAKKEAAPHSESP